MVSGIVCQRGGTPSVSDAQLLAAGFSFLFVPLLFLASNRGRHLISLKLSFSKFPEIPEYSCDLIPTLKCHTEALFLSVLISSLEWPLWSSGGTRSQDEDHQYLQEALPKLAILSSAVK